MVPHPAPLQTALSGFQRRPRIRRGGSLKLVVLPQALTNSIPAQVNTFIVVFKDTTLVLVIGIFDFFTTVKSGLGDAAWLGFSTEAYLFAASFYFAVSFAMSRYSQHLERMFRR